MARIIPMAGIESISGKVGKLIFKTRKKADGSSDIRMYKNPFYGEGYKRSTPVTEKEQEQRRLFAQTNRLVSERMAAGDKRRRSEIFKEVYADLKSGRIPKDETPVRRIKSASSAAGKVRKKCRASDNGSTMARQRPDNAPRAGKDL